MGFCHRLIRIITTKMRSMTYIHKTETVVAIFPPAIIASVAIQKANMIVQESPIIISRLISALVMKNVTGSKMAMRVKINRLFSWLAKVVSIRNNFMARIPRVINDIKANPPVIPGTPSEKFTALNMSTYQNMVIKTGRIYM